MTDSNYTHIAIVADRSGSMGAPTELGSKVTVAEATTDGIHKLVREQRAFPGKLTVSLTEFDDRIDVVENFGDGLTSLAWSCNPRGTTSLLDAVGSAIVKTGERLEALNEWERPSNVVFIIATDGYENTSQEYKLPQIKTLVQQQENVYGWHFVFAGVGIDAFADGVYIGTQSGSTVTVAAANTGAYYSSTSANLSNLRGGHAQTMTFTPEQVDDLKE